MSVPTSDFQSALETVIPDSQAGMPSPAAAGMPTVSGQSVASVDPGTPQPLAPADADPPIDVSQIPETTRAYLEAHFREGYIPQSDLANLQSTKDQEVARARADADVYKNQSDVAVAQAQRAVQLFGQYVAEVTSGKRQPHANDAASFTLAVQGAAQQVSHSRTQAEAQHRQWEASHAAGLQARISREAAAADGLPPVDPTVIANDAEVQRLNRELIETAQRDARERFQNPRHAQYAQSLWQQLEQRIVRVAQTARFQAVAQPIAKETQLVQQNLDRQEQRGVQTQSLPGMSALTGAYNPDAAWATAQMQIAAKYGYSGPGAAQQAEANHYDEIYSAWRPGYDAWVGRS